MDLKFKDSLGYIMRHTHPHTYRKGLFLFFPDPVLVPFNVLFCHVGVRVHDGEHSILFVFEFMARLRLLNQSREFGS